MQNEHVEIIIYEAEERTVEVRLDRDTVWLTQRQMAELFDTSSDNISLHLKNIFADEELEKKATTEDFSAVQKEGKRQVRRTLTHYNLDAIISVGYRVNSIDIETDDIQNVFVSRVTGMMGSTDFDYAPSTPEGGLSREHQFFGEDSDVIIEELNEALAA